MTIPKNRRANGFTLLEIVLVTAILAILTACCLPLFAEGRKRGQQSVCAAQLHQIGLAYSMYTQDFDQRPPQLETLTGSYLKSPSILLCPSDPWLHIAGDAGTNARQNASVGANGCSPLLVPLTYYYSGTTCDANSLQDAELWWNSLNKSMGSATGIVSCRVHGTRGQGWELNQVQSSAYEGKVLRLQLDGAVVLRHYSLLQSGGDKYLDIWSLFSDKPHISE